MTNNDDKSTQNAMYKLTDSAFSNSISEYYDMNNLVYLTEKAKDYKYKTLQLNIQGLPTKYNDLLVLCHSLKNSAIEPDFIMICETFLKRDNQDLYQIPGYKIAVKK